MNRMNNEFNNNELTKLMNTVIENPSNYEFKKGKVTDKIFTISIWRKDPEVDEGTFVYNNGAAERDADWDMLMEVDSMV